jgi:putative Holliday junction resolvase
MSNPHSASSSLFPPTGRLLGVDYGTKRVGLAISTPDRTIASPLSIYHRRNDSLDARNYKSVIDDYRIVGIVLGLPIHVSGEESQKSAEARKYGSWMTLISGLPVEYWDERYTSAVAEDYLLGADLTRQKRKQRLDMVAAQIMLQAYLDYHHPRPARGEDDSDFSAG